MVEKIKKIVFSRETVVFLLFLLLSTILWFIQSLDQKRISTIYVPIQYIGTPNDIKLSANKATKIRIKLQDKGTNLIQYGKNIDSPISLDMKGDYKDKGEIVLTSQQLKTIFAQRLQSTTSVLSVSPDTLRIEYEKLTTKRVPVHLESDVDLASQYIFSDKTKVEPDTITVYGSKQKLETLEYISTKKTTHSALQDTTKISLDLEKEPDGVNFSTKKVMVTFFVERFTERKQQVPVTIINNKKNENIKLFPSTVWVSYNIGIPHYNKVKKEDIKIIFDAQKAKKSTNKKYRPQIIVKSNYIKDININPTEIEFLIIENQNNL